MATAGTDRERLCLCHYQGIIWEHTLGRSIYVGLIPQRLVLEINLVLDELCTGFTQCYLRSRRVRTNLSTTY